MVDILPPFSVIRFPFDFRDGNGLQLKRFVVVGHRDGVAILIKPTSRLDYYQAQPDLLAGVVHCAAAQFTPFEDETILDPANAFAVPHDNLRRFHAAFTLDRLGVIPELRELLTMAVHGNKKIERARRENLLRYLQE